MSQSISESSANRNEKSPTLTEQHIDKMYASRDMDAVVASLVFGAVTDGDRSSIDPDAKETWRDTPHFSTDIADSLTILEKVCGRHGWSWKIESSDGCDSGPEFYVTIRNGPKKWEGDSLIILNDGDDMDNSLPLAICRAALKATLRK